jgi:signal transduction histidine kinase/predicted RNA-binding protein with RPS1 domain/DNA-binding NarL/FixJ family response regulator
MDQIEQPHSVGERVTVQVEKLFPYGVIVHLEDGTRGYIRRRELSWQADREPQQIVYVGQHIEAVVQLLPAANRLLELSVRATLPDPWDTFITRCRVGDTVEATVKRLLPHGIYAEIVPGVNGLVPRAELATWEITRTEDVFWIGDHIEAVVIGINGKPRGIMLSIRMRIQQLARGIKDIQAADQQAADSMSLQGEVVCLQQGMDSSIGDEESIQPVAGARNVELVGPILVVDDEISEALVAWLRRRGYIADAVKTSSEAREKTRQQHYGLLLVDIELKGIDGLDLIRQMQTERGEAKVAVMSATERLSDRISEIEELGVVGVFAKPLDLEEIEQFVDRIGQGEILPSWRATATEYELVEAKPFQEFLSTANTADSPGEQLHAGLTRLIEATRAEVGVVFYLDPTSQAVSIRAHAGTSVLLADAIYSLDDSPVKDVIRERALVFENRISSQEQLQRRFRKLLKLLSFDSCIGVPIEARSDTSHALFLFHRHQDSFHQYHLRDALATATLFAAVIERQIFDQQILSLGKFLLSGQLAAGFGHEVYNEMSGLEIQLRNLQTDYRLLGQRTLGQVDLVEIQGLQQAVDDLVDTARKLRGTAELFQGLMRAEGEETLDVHGALQKAATLLRPIRQRANVKLQLIQAANLPLALGSGVRLQQVFLNIMLNAIQHISAKPKGERVLEVATWYSDSAVERRIKVYFSDSGPGIHRQLWEKIFDLGFSTRPNGTGLGLFVARSLVESLGGKIAVLRSIVPIGTIFLVELRAAAPQERTQ